MNRLLSYPAGLLLMTLFAALVSGSEPPDLTRKVARERHMGTDFELIGYTSDVALAKRAFAAAFARIEYLNGLLSDYDGNSEVRRLCDSAPHSDPVEISRELWTVLRKAQALAQQSGGAFDVTVGPLTKLWRRARRQGQRPEPERLADARAHVGWEFVEVDPERPRVRILRDEVRIDLGGIAKGYAVDEALAVLAAHGLEAALVNGGGDLAVRGSPPDRDLWQIQVAGLREDDPPRMLELPKDRAIATSGDLWQFVELDGTRYSHIVDPKTGLGLTRRSSVSVLADDCCTADALASAISVLGPSKGRDLCAKIPHAELWALFLDATGKEIQVRTAGFPPMQEDSGAKH